MSEIELIPKVVVDSHCRKNSGTEQLAFYAIKETEHKNDLVSFWMRKSIAGLAWPVYHNRYHLQWPQDSSVYSHYVRPDVIE